MNEYEYMERVHYTCENCGKLDFFKDMATGFCTECLEYIKNEGSDHNE